MIYPTTSGSSSGIYATTSGVIPNVPPFTAPSVPSTGRYPTLRPTVNQEGILALQYSLDELRNQSNRLYLDFSDMQSLSQTGWGGGTSTIEGTGDSVTVTEEGVLVGGEYDIDVDQLAQGEVISSDAVDPDAALGMIGVFTIDGRVVTVERSDTLHNIRDKINGASSHTIASIDNGKLVLSSIHTGEGAVIEISEDGTPAAGSTNENVADVISVLDEGNWSVDVSVDQLAQEQIVRGDTQRNEASPLHLDGSFTIEGRTFTVTLNMSLEDIGQMINEADILVEASIEGDRLVLRSTVTGEIYVFSAADIDTGVENDHFTTNDGYIATTNTLINSSDWTHEVQVIKLAQIQRVEGYSYNPPNTALGKTGSFVVGDSTIQVVASDSTNDIIHKINAADNGIRAYVRQNGYYYDFILESEGTGVANNFSWHDVVEPGKDLILNTFMLTHGTGYGWDGRGDSTKIRQFAENAEYRVDGALRTSDSNTGVSIGDGTIDLHRIGKTTVQNRHHDKSNVLESTNTSVAVTKGLSDNHEFQHVIDVQQLAQRQVNQSNVWDPANGAFGVTGHMTINVSGNLTQVSVAATDGLTEIMENINNASTGITASIQHNRLVLTGDKTGAANEFYVYDTSGALEEIGLTGSNGLLSASSLVTAAQDAVYNINGNDYTHHSNYNIGVWYDVQVDLEAVGITTVQNERVNGENHITASNPSVVHIRGLHDHQDFSLTLTVQQLADRKRVASQFTNTLSLGKTGSLTITSGSGSATMNILSSHGAKAIADMINDANIGVRAYIEEDTATGTKTFVIEGTKTGSTNGFEISDSSGALETLGIANSSGGIRSDRIVSTAKDARYTINGTSYHHHSNHNIDVWRRTNVDLTGLGTTIIKNEHNDLVLEELGILKGDGSFQHVIQEAKDYAMTVDGRLETGWSNEDIAIQDEHGNYLASINIEETGDTTIYHTTGTLLQDLGILNEGNEKQHILQEAQDARYRINGEEYTSSTNEGISTDFGFSLSLNERGKSTLTVTEGSGGYPPIQELLVQKMNDYTSFLQRKGQHVSQEVRLRFQSVLQQHAATLLSMGIAVANNGTMYTRNTDAAIHLQGVQRLLDDMKNVASHVSQSPFGAFANQEYLNSLYNYQGMELLQLIQNRY